MGNQLKASQLTKTRDWKVTLTSGVPGLFWGQCRSVSCRGIGGGRKPAVALGKPAWGLSASTRGLPMENTKHTDTHVYIYTYTHMYYTCFCEEIAHKQKAEN